MLKVLDLFCGLGAPHAAFKRTNLKYKIVDAVELNEKAIATYNKLHGTNFLPQDITQWDKDIDVDFIIHTSPCQDFSISGKGLGGEDNTNTRSSLMWDTVRIVRKIKPKFLLWENVKNVTSKSHLPVFQKYLSTLEEMGYRNYYEVLNAKNFKVPQNRERLFCLSVLDDDRPFIFPMGELTHLRLIDIMEDIVDQKYFVSEETLSKAKIRNTIDFDKLLQTVVVMPEEPRPKGNYLPRERVFNNEGIARTVSCHQSQMPYYIDKSVRVGGLFDKVGTKHQAGSIYDKAGMSPAITTSQGGWRQPLVVASRGRYDTDGKICQNLEINKTGFSNTITSVQKDNYLSNGNWIRRLTPRECFRLFDFTEQDINTILSINSDRVSYILAGNTIAIPVLVAIFEAMIDTYDLEVYK